MSIEIPVFVVSTAGDEDNYVAVEHQLSKFAFLKVTCLEGTLGRYLPDTVCQTLTNDPNSINNKGALGCFLSHVRVWERVASREYRYPFALVLEDDVICNHFHLLEESLDDLSQLEFDLIFCNDRTLPANEAPENPDSIELVDIAAALSFIEERRKAIGTDGYLVTPRGARRLLDLVKYDLYFSHIDLRLMAYSVHGRAIDACAVCGPVLSELRDIQRLTGHEAKIVTFCTMPSLVTHTASGSRREREDRFIRLKDEQLSLSGNYARRAEEFGAPIDRTEISTVLDKMCAPMRELLEEFRGRDVLFFPNPGNGGDSLIAAGSYQAFQRAGIVITSIDRRADVSGATVFMGGGGNLVPIYKEMREALKLFIGRARRVVLLPHTIRGNEDLLQELGGEITVFCRDNESYDHVRLLCKKAQIFRAHDMAFHIDVETLERKMALRLDVISFWEKKIAEAGWSARRLREQEECDFSRTDWESRDQTPRSEMDISAAFALGVGVDQASAASWCLLNTLKRTRRVRTDRLHVAIASAILGVNCALRDNSYGKNWHVYQYSLKPFFRTIEWAEQ